MKIITLCSTILSICAIRLKQTYSDLKFYKGIRDTNNSTCVYSDIPRMGHRRRYRSSYQ